MNASQFVIYAGSSYDGSTPIGLALNASISLSEDPRDTTNKFSGGWRTLAEGLRSWSGSGEHLFSEVSTNGVAQLWDAFLSRGELFCKVTSHVDGDEVNGDSRFRGKIRITSLEQTGGVEDNVQFSFSFEGVGALIRETISE
jgi:predicted secreted protein